MATTKEYQAFKAAYYTLSQSITHPEALAGILWSRGHITTLERRDAEEASVSAYKRTIALLEVLSKKIELQPEALYELVKVLNSSGDSTLMYMGRLLNPASSTGSSNSQQPLQESRESTNDLTEAQMLEFFKKIGIPQKDVDLLIDEGFGTGPGFMELTKDDIKDMKFTRGGRKMLLKQVSSDQPVAMDTTPPATAMYPIPKHAAMDHAAGGPPLPFPYTPPPEPLTADSIAEEIGLDPYVLDTEFSDNYSVILAFAKVMPEWKQIGQSLHLSPQDLRSIETNVSLSYLMQCTETLKKWKSRYGFKARYRMLINAALAHEDDKLAIQFCRLVQKTIGGSQPVRVPAQPAPLVVKDITLDTLIEALRPLTFSRSNHGQLARALGISEYKLSEIEANNYQDIAQVRIQILSEWMKNDDELSWETVARAVLQTGDKNLARRLMAYRTPAA